MRLEELLRGAARWCACFAAAGVLSYGCAYWLLGFRLLSDPFSEVAQVRDQIRKVVAFDSGGDCGRCFVGFMQALDLPEAELLAAQGQSQELLVTLEQVEALNPYPPVLKPPFYHPSWLSLGYLSDDDRYHQVTWYGGEADTTPSILVPKVPGRTGQGDYFVRYTVRISREITQQPLLSSNETGEVTRWRGPRPWPDLESITWDTYAGGSYDGLEEIGFTFLGTIVVGPLLALVTRRRRSESRQPREGPPNKRLEWPWPSSSESEIK